MARQRAKGFKIGDIECGQGRPLILIAGPCVIESRHGCVTLARRLAALAERLEIPLIFKASFDKANRTSLDSFRGPGLKEGLAILREVKERFGLPLITDIHESWQAEEVAESVDIIQIPAFLCRQTDLLLAAGRTGRVVNVKKAQFLEAGDMTHVVRKIESTGNRKIMLTERGNSFGYHNLVVDMRNLLIMRQSGYPVIYDATHSVQRPGAAGGRSGGDGQWAPALARAAVATGCDGLFIETHLKPQEALSDRDNAIALRLLGPLWQTLTEIHRYATP